MKRQAQELEDKIKSRLCMLPYTQQQVITKELNRLLARELLSSVEDINTPLYQALGDLLTRDHVDTDCLDDEFIEEHSIALQSRGMETSLELPGTHCDFFPYKCIYPATDKEQQKSNLLKKKLLAHGLVEQRFSSNIDIRATVLTCRVNANRYPGDNRRIYTLYYNGEMIASMNQVLA